MKRNSRRDSGPKQGRPFTDAALLEARGAFKKSPGRHRGRAKEVAQKEAKVEKRDYAGIIEKYCNDITNGVIPACRDVKLAVLRHLKDCALSQDEKYPYGFDAGAMADFLHRLEKYRHIKGKWAAGGQHITLEPWQCFSLGIPFGWVRKRDSKRRFREIYICVPRKNAKSTMAAIVGLDMMIDDGEHAAEVYAGATSEKQAWEVFGPAREMAKLARRDGVEIWARALVKTDDTSRFWPIIGNPGDGASPSCAIVDEYHEHITSSLLDTMVTGMGAREQPMLLVITTAGSDLASPCREKHLEVERVLEGVVENPELFGIIYTIDLPNEKTGDKGDDWADPKALRKANPNIGVSVDEEFLQAQQRQAVINPIYQTRFKTKHLNIWCAATVAGINMHQWALCSDPGLLLEDFHGESCWAVLDLATKVDICAFMMVFKKIVNALTHYYAFGRYYLPVDTIEESRHNKDIYRKWVIQNHLVAVPGAEVDFEAIRVDVMDFKSKFKIEELIYDPWRATHLAQMLRSAGATTVEFPQSGQHMAAGYDELTAAIKAGRFHHDGNPVLAWMANNVRARTIAKGLVVPAKDKSDSPQKIDGIVATCMGISRAMGQVQSQEPQMMILG